MPVFHRNSLSSLSISYGRGFVARHRQPIITVATALIVVCAAMIAIQWWYGQQQLVRPWTRIGDVSYANQQRSHVETAIHDNYSNAQLVVSVKDKRITTPIVKAGIAPDAQAAAQQVTDYPAWQRWIPFTLLAHIGQKFQVTPKTDAVRLHQFVTDKIAPICHKPAADANVEVVDGQLKLRPGQAGSECADDNVIEQLNSSVITSDKLAISVKPTALQPAVSTDAARQVLAKAVSIVNRSLQVQILDQVSTPTKQQLADWLEFVPDVKSGDLTIKISDTAVKKYIESLQKSIYIKPGQTVVKLVDGDEASRLVGASGQGIAMKDGIERVSQQLLADDGIVVLQPIVLPPTLRYDRTYTKTEAGLRALVKSLAAKDDVAISVQHIGGDRGWSANANGNKVYTPASTYKLFVAYATLKRIESGSMKWGDRATGGQNISDCFDAMIIHSDNACAEWFGEKIGWRTITDMIHAVGISKSTSLYTKHGFVATANDEALFLTKLQQGKLLSSSSTKRLLAVMKRQVYRSGIPAGVGLTVADKVGFLNGLLHDAAIVYAPSGTYALVIMTNNSSWAHIADIAHQINQHLR